MTHWPKLGIKLSQTQETGMQSYYGPERESAGAGGWEYLVNSNYDYHKPPNSFLRTAPEA